MITYALNKPFGKSFSKRSQKGRDKFETPRQKYVDSIGKDLKRIVDTELSFSKSLIKHMIPVNVSIDKNATGIKKFIPIDITLDIEEDPVEFTEVVYDNKENDAVLNDE